MTSRWITIFIFLGLGNSWAGYTPDMYPTTNSLRSTNPPARTVWYQHVVNVVSNYVCTNYVTAPESPQCYWKITTNDYWDHITPWAPTNEIVTSVAGYRVLAPTNDPDYDIPTSNFWKTVYLTNIGTRTYSTNAFPNGPDLWACEAFASISEKVARISVGGNNIFATNFVDEDLWYFMLTNREAFYPRISLMRNELMNLKEIARSLNAIGCFFLSGRPKRAFDQLNSPSTASLFDFDRHEPSPIDEGWSTTNNAWYFSATNRYRFFSDLPGLTNWTWERAYAEAYEAVFTNHSILDDNVRNMMDWNEAFGTSSNELREMNKPKSNTMAWAQAFEFLNAMTTNALVPAMSVLSTCGTALYYQAVQVQGFSNSNSEIDRSFIFLSKPFGSSVPEMKSSSIVKPAGDAEIVTNLWAFHNTPNVNDASLQVLWDAPRLRRVVDDRLVHVLGVESDYYSASGERYTSFGWTVDNNDGAQNISTGTGVAVLRFILDSWVGSSVTSAIYVCAGSTNIAYSWPEATNPVIASGTIEFFNCGVYSAQVCRAEEGATTNLSNHTLTYNSDGTEVEFNVELYHEVVRAFTNSCGNEYGQVISDGGVVWVDFYMDFREAARGSTNGVRGTWKLAPDYEWRY